MNRKLHNTASALMVTGTLFVLGLLGQLSIPPATPASPIAVAAASAAADTSGSSQVDATPPRHGNGRSRRIRQSMAMPFFSFASRG